MKKTKTDKPCSNLCFSLPEWHGEICAAVKTITDHISITVLRHVREHMATMGDETNRDFDSVLFWVKQYYLCKLDSRLASDTYSESYHTDFIQLINPNQDDKISEMLEKQLRAFYIAGYIDGAADTDALPK